MPWSLSGGVSPFRFLICSGSVIAAVMLTLPPGADGQDFIGKRQFPDQLVVREAFVESTLTVPSVLHIRDGNPGEQQTFLTGELKLRLTPNLGVGVAGTLALLEADDGGHTTGFEDLEIGVTYQVFKSEARETLVSLALGWVVGGTGARSVGAERASVFTPGVLFAQGFGALPEAMTWLRPLAVNGEIGMSVATDPLANGSQTAGRLGVVIEYSLPYLEEYLRRPQLPPPLNRLFPIVELELDRPFDGPRRGKVTGTVNPGFLWVGEVVQVGVEAAVPINSRTGTSPGIRALLRVSLDEIAPWLGRPLFGAP